MINKVAVISSNISSAGHDGNTMEITFKSGQSYQAAVPKSEYDAFMAAKSKGSHFAKILKNAYKWEKV